ncbi:MAG: hypothetical protein M0Z99_31005 [Betaproteobacteria bacterium]|nr:hypothetical protein [Betaproteobacteria bacterium]
MSEALFDSAHAALVFDFQQRIRSVDRVPLNRIGCIGEPAA